MEANKTQAICADNGKVGANGESKECVELETDVNDVVKYVTSGLVETRSLEVISSESEDGTPEVECDSDAIDVSVIEADMDLEELMKQKELLQAEIAKALNAEVDSPVETKKNGKKEKVDEIILLDDSSNDAEIYTKPNKFLHSRERIVIERRDGINRNESRRHRSYSRERIHKEIDKAKSDRAYAKEVRSHDHKSLERTRGSRDVDYKFRDLRRSRSRDRKAGGRDKDFSRDRSYDREHSRGRELQMDKRRQQFGSRVRYPSRDRSNKYNDRDRHRGRDRSRERDRRDRDRYKGKNEKYDKYQGSLSEGLKQVVSGSDSDAELDIDINDDEEDEQLIIERRRKQREELLKVSYHFFVS